MQLSDFMRLPNWQGQIHIPSLERTYSLIVSDDGTKLVLRHNSSTYYIEDQTVEMGTDGGVFVKVRAKMRMNRSMPVGNRIYLLDTECNNILPHQLDEYLPSVPPQGHYQPTPRHLMI